MEGAHLRRESRTDVHLPAQVRLPAGDHAGVVADLSAHGARVVTSGRASRGDRVRIAVANSVPPVVLEGTVRHVSTEGFGVELEPGAAARARGLLSGRAPEASEAGEASARP